MSDTQNKHAVSGADVISLVKESNDLLEQSLLQLGTAEKKVASFSADSKEATALVTQAVDKLANLRINGTPLIDEGDKQDFVAGMGTKVGMAEVLNQVLDHFEKHAGAGIGQKVAASLGEASDRPQVTGPGRDGFASLPSHRVQM